MTDETQERLNNWIKWGFQGLLAAVMGWMAINIESSRKKDEEMTSALIRLEARVEAMAVMTGDRYTLSHARADWSRQELVDAQQDERLSTMNTRYNEWTSRLSDRVRAVEEEVREN